MDDLEEITDIPVDIAESVTEDIADVTETVATVVADASNETLAALSEALRVQADTNSQTLNSVLSMVNSINSAVTELAARGIDTSAEIVSDAGELPKEIVDVVVEGDAPGPTKEKGKRRMMRRKS